MDRFNNKAGTAIFCLTLISEIVSIIAARYLTPGRMSHDSTKKEGKLGNPRLPS